MKLDCSHEDNNPKSICIHLFNKTAEYYCQYFTGKGLGYILICSECKGKVDTDELILAHVCNSCFKEIEDACYMDDLGIFGQPEILRKNTNLHLAHKIVKIDFFSDKKILLLKPSPVDHCWYALISSGNLVKIDFQNITYEQLPPIPEFTIEIENQYVFEISHNARWAALAEKKGRTGIVWEINNGKKLFFLDRNDYDIEHCIFSLAFIIYENRTYLIHATDWNRLDITDLETGEIITDRGPTNYTDDGEPEHYLDYFHCGLLVSPDNQWIIDNGWVWHPIGIVVCWNIVDWMSNVWESEDGPSKKNLLERFYYWDGPLCWIDNERAAIYGYGNDEMNLIPAVCIFNVRTGEMEKWFPGPEGNLYFDELLFSSSEEKGIAVWDIETGECLFNDKNMNFLSYNPKSHSFINIRSDGSFQLSCLVDNNEVVVKTGEAIYDNIKKYKVIIKESKIRYGTGDYEDDPEFSNDVVCNCYYYAFESLLEKNVYNSSGFAGYTLEEAMQNVEKILNHKVYWE